MTDAGLEVVGKLTRQALPNTHIKYEMLKKKIDYLEDTDIILLHCIFFFINENLKNTYYFVQLITSLVIVLYYCTSKLLIRIILFIYVQFSFISGTVTDEEFNSLRTQGERGSFHIWQVVHDSKEAVRRMSKTTLQSMLTYAGGRC